MGFVRLMNGIKYSIVIPAYNEESLLGECIGRAQSAMAAVDATLVDVRSELIIVDNNSSDNTQTIAHQSGAKVVFEPINQISRARNSGARVAQGDFYIFLDADTKLTKELLMSAIEALSELSWCGGGAPVKLAGSGTSLAKFFFIAVLKFYQMQNTASGCFIFCRADAFASVGGFSELLYASEEYWFSRKLGRYG